MGLWELVVVVVASIQAMMMMMRITLFCFGFLLFNQTMCLYKYIIIV